MTPAPWALQSPAAPTAPTVGSSTDGASSTGETGSSAKPKRKESRPKFRKKTIEGAWDGMEDGPVIGTKVCPTCPKVIDNSKAKDGKRTWDVDHTKEKWADRLKRLKEKGAGKKEVNDDYQKDVRGQCRRCNRNHEHEPKPGGGGGPPQQTR